MSTMPPGCRIIIKTNSSASIEVTLYYDDRGERVSLRHYWLMVPWFAGLRLRRIVWWLRLTADRRVRRYRASLAAARNAQARLA